jgi:hypothetical protein
VDVVEARVAERGSKFVAAKLGMPARTGETADVSDERNLFRVNQGEKVGQLAVGMADGP